ncbi:MAG: hypothetical protein A2139_09330 [Desulfobacca sp. RBG_16_60_12]|nr:MAG: hypothetical protein A2139_09330 [Desulfobacca sp. RBG_16_60_12]
MQARWGIAWLVTAIWLFALMWVPAPGLAAGDYSYRSFPILPNEAQSSLETQMLGEKRLPSAGPLFPGIQSAPSLQLHPEGSDASLKLPLNTELNISIRYNREPTPGDPQPLSKSPLYMKYAVDYRLLPNLRVGLNSYLYRPAEDGFAFQRPMGNQLLGVGPELKYDLGRWSFLLKSQLETGNRDQGKDLQNWFRVWYAF